MKPRIQLLVTALAAILILGQRAAADSAFTVDVWSTEDGLPQRSVLAITQTRDGYLWLGTLNGLVRFDGNSMTTFDVNNTPGLPDNGITFLFEDSRTNLWVGTQNGGLCTMQNGMAGNIHASAGKILYAYEDETGAIWFCAQDGRIIRWSNGQMDMRPPFTPVFGEQLFRRAYHLVTPGQSGDFWHLEAQNHHVEKWKGDQLEADFGLFHWTPNIVVFPFLTTRSGIVFDAMIAATCVDHDGNLIAGTKGEGVFWMDAQGRWRQIILGKKPSENFVTSLCFDREGNLWAGTDGGGLCRVRRGYFETPAGLPSGVAKSVAEDSEGGIWATYNARGLAYSLTNSTSFFGIGRGSNAWSVLVDRNQQVWAGTYEDGLFRYNGHGFEPVTNAPLLQPLYALFQSRDGKLWAGGQDGLASFDGQSWRNFSSADGLPSGAVRALAEDGNSNLWLGVDGAGVFKMQNGKISAVTTSLKDVSCLLSDPDGVLWAGTSGHGLRRFAQGQWTVYSSADGLLGDDIGYLVEDDFTNLWVGSYEGLMRIEKNSLADFAAGTIKKVSSRTFLTRECSAGAQPAALRSRDGRLLFPTIEGVVSVNPADLRPNTNPPPVVIESVLVDGVRQNEALGGPTGPQTIVLRPENEQLEIHFTALDFSAPKGAQLAVRFRYQLEGRDTKVVDIGGERVAHFGKLSPDNYIFHVMACNEDGYWNDTGASINITVEPPFWRTRGFVATSSLILLAVLAGTIYLISTAKLRRQLRLAQQKELIEHERARIARDLHDQLGANLTQITLLGEMAEADKELPEEIEQHAEQICATARETTRSLDEIVWAVNPSNDTLESLANYACKYAQDYFAMARVSYRAELPSGLPPTPILPEVRHNVFLAFKEAVNNVVKHAYATEARVKLQLEPGQFILSVTDNGRGLGDISDKQLRNGMKNMRRRLADVRGEFDIAPGTAGGTVVRLTVPIKTMTNNKA